MDVLLWIWPVEGLLLDARRGGCRCAGRGGAAGRRGACRGACRCGAACRVACGSACILPLCPPASSLPPFSPLAELFCAFWVVSEAAADAVMVCLRPLLLCLAGAEEACEADAGPAAALSRDPAVVRRCAS